MLQQDTLFANRYQLRSLIGRGGFSEVWLAHDTWTDLDIAIKVYAPGQGLDSDGLKEFCQELAGVHHLTHPNLLKPDHVDQWENMPYLIMEYCPKGALSKQVGKLSEKQVWKVLHDVAAGLAYLHSKDIVHQDIKPDNILLDESGNYRITDFGISTKARTTLRKSMLGASTSGGTMAYMGPERFSAQPAPTKASDIWSLGAMIYELITGDVPFGEIGGGMQKNGAEIPDIAQPISPALTQVIHLMLAKETWDRPTAETLVTWAADPSLVKSIEPPHVPRSPRIISFSAASQISKGQQCTIFWNTENVKHVVVNGEAYPANYTLSLSLNSTTTIQLAFIGEDGTTLEKEVTVKVIQTPPASKPKTSNRNKGVWIFIILVVIGSLLATTCGVQQSRQREKNNITLCHTAAISRFDNAIDNANNDKLEELNKALSELDSIKKYEDLPIYEGSRVYSAKKKLLKDKSVTIYNDLFGKYQRAPMGTTTEKKLLDKLNKVTEVINSCSDTSIPTTHQINQMSAEINSVHIEHNVTNNGITGMRIHVNFNCEHMRTFQGLCIAWFYNADGTCMRNENSSNYSDEYSNICTWDTFTPNYDSATFSDYILFIPNNVITGRGQNLYFKIVIQEFTTGKNFV